MSYVHVVAEAWSESCVLAATVPDVVGYLHNRLRSQPGGDRRQRCGTERRPWIVSVLPGQRINITLLDFTAFHGRQLPRTNRKARRRLYSSLVQFLIYRVRRNNSNPQPGIAEGAKRREGFFWKFAHGVRNCRQYRLRRIRFSGEHHRRRCMIRVVAVAVKPRSQLQ